MFYFRSCWVLRKLFNNENFPIYGIFTVYTNHENIFTMKLSRSTVSKILLEHLEVLYMCYTVQPRKIETYNLSCVLGVNKVWTHSLKVWKQVCCWSREQNRSKLSHILNCPALFVYFMLQLHDYQVSYMIYLMFSNGFCCSFSVFPPKCFVHMATKSHASFISGA